MTTESVFDLCLPILEDADIDEDDKTDKVEELIKKETDLTGKAAQEAVLDILWRFRNNLKPSAASPAVRHTVVRRNSPAPWQASRGATPLTSSPRSTAASPVPPSGFSARPAVLRMKSAQQQSPFTSPRSSPRLPHATPHIPHSPSLNNYTFSDRVPGPDTFGDYGSDNVDWIVNDDAASNASSSYGCDFGFGDSSQPQLFDMSPYDMLRSVLRDQKTDEEIEGILEANGYDLSAAIMSLMDGQGVDTAPTPEQEKTFLVGKSMAPGSRPTTPAGQAKSNVLCRYWLQTGQCLRADCRFSHDLSNHVCKYWLAGNCLAGDSCVFSHDPSLIMGNMSLNDSGYAGTPSIDGHPAKLQLSDYNSFPSLQGGSTSNSSANLESSLRNLYPSGTSVPAPPGFLSRPALAPEFIPSQPQSRPTSRHHSPARQSGARFSAEDNDAFPSLGAAAMRGPKKHHGKRGHGHGHRDRDASSNQPGSLADLVRMSPAPANTATATAASPRRGLRARASNPEGAAAASTIPAPEHIPWLETGDRANKEYLKARQDAIRHGGARNKFLQSAAQAWNRNDVRAAKALSLRGQSENDLMRESHREAARALYDLRNRSHGHPASASAAETYVDLHGLHPAEAVGYLDAALKNQRSARALHRDGSAVLYAIVGTGHHSKGGRDKVGKAVRAFLNDAGFVWREFSVAGSAGSGGSGGILGVDASTGRTGIVARTGGEEGDDEEERPAPPLMPGKIRILKADGAAEGL